MIIKKHKQNSGQIWDMIILLRTQVKHKTDSKLRVVLFKFVEMEREKVEEICDMIYQMIT